MKEMQQRLEQLKLEEERRKQEEEEKQRALEEAENRRLEKVFIFFMPLCVSSRCTCKGENWLATLVPEVFLDFSLRKRSRASREAATRSCESDEEREKNLWLPWPRISLSC